MTIVTSIYETAHGRKPRPSQDSVWSFLITRRPGEAITFQTSGTYREAARAVKAEAKIVGGASKITVMAYHP